MNGMKSGVRIVELRPWWKDLVLGVQIGSGVVTGISVLMAVASFVLPVIIKKKENNV